MSASEAVLGITSTERDITPALTSRSALAALCDAQTEEQERVTDSLCAVWLCRGDGI